MRAVSSLFALALLLSACGGERPDVSSAGLGQLCPDEGCAEGQECVTAAGPEGDLSTCEIRCDANEDCPEGTACQLPPVQPDALANVCG